MTHGAIPLPAGCRLRHSPLTAALRGIAAVQTIGTVARNRSFVGAVVDGWVRWKLPAPVA